MNKAVAIVLLIIAAIVAIWVIRDDGVQGPDNQVAQYFEDRIIARAIENMGGMMPIEGFDAQLLMGAYDGLVASDFQGVETLEGHYEVQDGEVVFERDANAQSISTAERTVSSEGYATLLNNIDDRVDGEIDTNEEVDTLLSELTTSQTLWLGLNQSATAFGATIVPLQVVEDSRCPLDAQCIQAGTVRVRTSLISGMGTATETFVLNQPITTEAESVTLTEVAPEPTAGVAIPTSEYQFVFRVEKR